MRVLSRSDLYAEKLLANADRGLDRVSLHRDLIDLCVMHQRWGAIPAGAWKKARDAYGASIDGAVAAVAARLKHAATRRECLAALDASPEVDGDIAGALKAGLARKRSR